MSGFSFIFKIESNETKNAFISPYNTATIEYGKHNATIMDSNDCVEK